MNTIDTAISKTSTVTIPRLFIVIIVTISTLTILKCLNLLPLPPKKYSQPKLVIYLYTCLKVCLVSRGCGFVQFPDQRLQKLALEECQGAVGLGSKPLRLSLAANK